MLDMRNFLLRNISSPKEVEINESLILILLKEMSFIFTEDSYLNEVDGDCRELILKVFNSVRLLNI